jgi:DnaJ-class molecular chaperone
MATKREANTIELGNYEVQTLPKGEFVNRTFKCSGCVGTGNIAAHEGSADPMRDCTICNGTGLMPGNKVFKLAGYDRSERKWQLDDCDDISRCVYVKRGTMLHAGFSY